MASAKDGIAASARPQFSRARTSSIRVRYNDETSRPSSSSRQRSVENFATVQTAPQVDDHGDVVLNTSPSHRRTRAASDPQGNQHRSARRNQIPASRSQHALNQAGLEHLPDLTEENERKSMAQRPADFDVGSEAEKQPQQEVLDPGKRRLFKSRLRATSAATAPISGNSARSRGEYDNHMVDLLDLVDPEISTLSTLTNVQNSLFIPNLGRLINRRPTYNLTRAVQDDTDTDAEDLIERETPIIEDIDDDLQGRLRRITTTASIKSRPTSDHYAVLPHGTDLTGWSHEDQAMLDDHVRHMLHSRRSRFKRSLKGFGQYVKKPLGFFVTLYATLITLFGLAWVLFLIGWINVGGKQLYIINIIDNVLVALFAIMGDGLIPWRIVDTYHMIWIAHYAHTTWRLRKEKHLPKLQNHNELPAVHETDIEAANESKIHADEELSVLSPLQQKRLIHHQTKFSNSHTFYKPHETTTHHAFPIRLLIAVVVLLDFHSCLQLSLGLCTWIIDYRVRPFALTTVILCCSITVNITAGILISVGDRRTRKKDVLERMHKQELTAEAMRKLEKRKRKTDEREKEVETLSQSKDDRASMHEMRRGTKSGEIVREYDNIVPVPRPQSSRELRPSPRNEKWQGTRSVLKNGLI